MQYAYEPYVLWRRAKGRIFCVNPNIPFEFSMFCFQKEQPFFLVSSLEDGRVAITPNAMCIPWDLHQTGFWPQDLLPTGYEYFTIKNGTYPVLVSAHPIQNFEEWYRKFERCVEPFAQQSLMEFVTSSYERLPVHLESRSEYTAKEKVTA
jgi:hypothetical protein